MTEFEKIIQLLDENNIDYILIGGFAGAVHGSARLTSDIDNRVVAKFDFMLV